jgi:hypothetical protein
MFFKVCNVFELLKTWFHKIHTYPQTLNFHELFNQSHYFVEQYSLKNKIVEENCDWEFVEPFGEQLN